MIGRNHNFLKSGKHDAEFYKNLWQLLQTEGCWQGEIWNRKKSGELYVELLTISAMRNPKGEIVNYVGLFSDITQSKLHQQALEEMAHHDPLTHLPNRTLFSDRFQQAMARCKRDNSMLGVVYMDLDGFKQINDNLATMPATSCWWKWRRACGPVCARTIPSAVWAATSLRY